jgi:hypothetical protein
MEQTTKVFQWQDYELRCSAKPAEDGRFVPDLVVSKRVWPTRARQIAVPRGQHVSEDTAIEAAYEQGIAWVRDWG